MKKMYLLGILAAFVLAGCSSAKPAESSSADTSKAETTVTGETTHRKQEYFYSGI